MKHPDIDAPGLVWRELKRGRWSIKWQARSDLVRKGYSPAHVRLWSGTLEELLAPDLEWVAHRSQTLQNDMLAFSRQGEQRAVLFDNTVGGLIDCYLSDKSSPYHEKRYFTRKHYDNLCARLKADHGKEFLAHIKARDLKDWYRAIASQGKLAMAHGVIGMLRTAVGYGVTMLEDDECERLSVVLSKLRFATSKARTESITADQVIALRAMAREMGFPSIALAQAFQFDGTLRQKDVIGEMIPISEPGVSAITVGNSKWMCGLDWSKIDNNWTLRHITSKRQKEVTINLTLASMVMEELGNTDRAAFPASGPVIVCEKTGLPWNADGFRYAWRQLATKAGIPKGVKNMDTRSGAITEAFQSGARPDAIQKSATHSTLAMTSRYNRRDADDIEDVMASRAKHRIKTGTKH